MPLDQFRQVQARQVLHHIVVGSVFGPAIVVNLDGVGMGEGGGEANLALESLQGLGVGHLARPDQLDGARTLQKLVFGQVNLAHTAAADLAAEVILAELSRLGNLPAQHEKGAGPERGADRKDEQDQSIKAVKQEAGRLALPPAVP